MSKKIADRLVTFNLRITPEMREELKERAYLERLNVTQLIRNYLEKMLKKNIDKKN